MSSVQVAPQKGFAPQGNPDPPDLHAWCHRSDSTRKLSLSSTDLLCRRHRTEEGYSPGRLYLGLSTLMYCEREGQGHVVSHTLCHNTTKGTDVRRGGEQV